MKKICEAKERSATKSYKKNKRNKKLFEHGKEKCNKNETWAKKYARDSCKQNMERNMQQKRVPISKKTLVETLLIKELLWRKKAQTKMRTFMNKFIKEMKALKNKTSKELCANITNMETQKKLDNRVLIRKFSWEGKRHK